MFKICLQMKISWEIRIKKKKKGKSREILSLILTNNNIFIFNYIKIIYFLWHFPTNIPWKPPILKTSWHFPKKIISWDQYLWQGLTGSTYIHGANSSPLHTTLAWFSACSKTDHSFARSLPVSPYIVNEKKVPRGGHIEHQTIPFLWTNHAEATNKHNCSVISW